MQIKKYSSGLVQIPLLIGLLITAIAIPVATKLVQDSQENRGRAYEDDSECTYDGDCGTGYRCLSGFCVKKDTSCTPNWVNATSCGSAGTLTQQDGCGNYRTVICSTPTGCVPKDLKCEACKNGYQQCSNGCNTFSKVCTMPTVVVLTPTNTPIPPTSTPKTCDNQPIGTKQCTADTSKYNVCEEGNWYSYSCPSGQICSEDGICSNSPTPTTPAPSSNQCSNTSRTDLACRSVTVGELGGCNIGLAIRNKKCFKYQNSDDCFCGIAPDTGKYCSGTSMNTDLACKTVGVGQVGGCAPGFSCQLYPGTTDECYCSSTSPYVSDKCTDGWPSDLACNGATPDSRGGCLSGFICKMYNDSRGCYCSTPPTPTTSTPSSNQCSNTSRTDLACRSVTVGELGGCNVGYQCTKYPDSNSCFCGQKPKETISNTCKDDYSSDIGCRNVSVGDKGNCLYGYICRRYQSSESCFCGPDPTSPTPSPTTNCANGYPSDLACYGVTPNSKGGCSFGNTCLKYSTSNGCYCGIAPLSVPTAAPVVRPPGLGYLFKIFTVKSAFAYDPDAKYFCDSIVKNSHGTCNWLQNGTTWKSWNCQDLEKFCQSPTNNTPPTATPTCQANNYCQYETCSNDTCTDSCGNTYQGKKQCSTIPTPIPTSSNLINNCNPGDICVDGFLGSGSCSGPMYGESGICQLPLIFNMTRNGKCCTPKTGCNADRLGQCGTAGGCSAGVMCTYDSSRKTYGCNASCTNPPTPTYKPLPDGSFCGREGNYGPEACSNCLSGQYFINAQGITYCSSSHLITCSAPHVGFCGKDGGCEPGVMCTYNSNNKTYGCNASCINTPTSVQPTPTSVVECINNSTNCAGRIKFKCIKGVWTLQETCSSYCQMINEVATCVDKIITPVPTKIPTPPTPTPSLNIFQQIFKFFGF